MKKLFYITIFAAISSLAITSCTEDEVIPTTTQTETDNGGGGTSDGPRPK